MMPEQIDRSPSTVDIRVSKLVVSVPDLSSPEIKATRIIIFVAVSASLTFV